MTTAIALNELDILSSPQTEREERGRKLARLFIGEMVPLLVQVRQDFLDKERNELICGAKTWMEYCTGILRYSVRHIDRLIGGKNPASEKHDGSANRKRQLTDADVAAYELEHPDIRQLTEKLLKQMTAADVVGALIGMETPPPIAEAIVRSVQTSAQSSSLPAEPAEPKPALQTVQEFEAWLTANDDTALDSVLMDSRKDAETLVLKFLNIKPAIAKLLTEYYVLCVAASPKEYEHDDTVI